MVGVKFRRDTANPISDLRYDLTLQSHTYDAFLSIRVAVIQAAMIYHRQSSKSEISASDRRFRINVQ